MTLQGEWVPEDEHLDTPWMTLRTALRTSSNRAAVRMLEEVGIPSAVSFAKRLGVGSVPSVPSLVLGSGEVTLLSMTSAYGAFANGGVLASPQLIRRVEDRDGSVLYEAERAEARAVSETTAFLITTMMADVINSGTAWTARREGFTLPAAGKTGTTNDYHDAWFVGYTPKLVSGVWVGYDQPKPIVANGYASELAVPMWSRFMRDATRRDGAEWFQPPASITTASICRLSGRLAGEGCRDVVTVNPEGGLSRESLEYTEYFIRGTEPTDYCPLHGRVHGQIAVVPASSGVDGVAATVPSIRPSTPGSLGQQPHAATAPSNPSAATTTAQAPPPEEPKKRGFWGRIFGKR
jgi:penicillin-binding protein 1A